MADPVTPSEEREDQRIGVVNAPILPQAISLNTVAGGSNLQIRERSIDDKREDARKGLAYIIVGCFVVTIVWSFLLFMTKGTNSTDDILKVVQAIIAPVSAIVGAVTGFYFSSNQNNSGQQNTNSSNPP